MNGVQECWAIWLKDRNRWFTGFGKRKVLKSAWSLAGAAMTSSDDGLDSAFDELEKRGYKPEFKLITAVAGV